MTGRHGKWLVLIAAAALPAGYSLGQTEVGNCKEPPGCSDAEKLQILTHSPWAKVVRSRAPTPAVTGAQVVFASSPGGDHYGGFLHSPSARVPSSSTQRNSQSALALYSPITVRWESASPIREFSETALPDTFGNHYVLSLKGFPASMLRPDGSLRPDALLSVRNRQPRTAEFVALTEDKRTLLLAFPPFDPPVTQLDNTIVFKMSLSGIEIVAKFDPKKMVWLGRLNL